MADHPHITCREVVELVSDYLERAMTVRETALFEQHLLTCDGCVSYVDQLQHTINAVGRISEEDVPADAREKLMNAFREWKRQ